MSHTIIWTIESVSVFLMLTRWSWKLHAGDYPTFTDSPEVAGAFIAHVVTGLVPPLVLAYVLGGALHRRDVRRTEEAKQLAAEQREVDRVLETSR